MRKVVKKVRDFAKAVKQHFSEMVGFAAVVAFIAGLYIVAGPELFWRLVGALIVSLSEIAVAFAMLAFFSLLHA